MTSLRGGAVAPFLACTPFTILPLGCPLSILLVWLVNDASQLQVSHKLFAECAIRLAHMHVNAKASVALQAPSDVAEQSQGLCNEYDNC